MHSPPGRSLASTHAAAPLPRWRSIGREPIDRTAKSPFRAGSSAERTSNAVDQRGLLPDCYGDAVTNRFAEVVVRAADEERAALAVDVADEFEFQIAEHMCVWNSI